MALGAKTGGRQKGTPNRITKDLRDMVQQALHKAGGVKYLEKQAQEEPAAFLSLLGKCLPKDVKVTGEVELLHILREAAKPRGD